MTPRPADAHRDAVSPRAFDVVRVVIEKLESLGVEYVLGGGWAVYAYGSRVPSVDTDVWLPGEEGLAAVRVVAADTGVAAGPGKELEPLDLDAFASLRGTDPEFGEPDVGFVPRQVLSGATVRRAFDVSGAAVEAVVPAAAELAFMKLAAYHDRELAWRARRDAQVMALLPNAERQELYGRDPRYLLRKAGKDLYDIAHLCTSHTTLEEGFRVARRDGVSAGFEDAVRHPWAKVPQALVDFALDLSTGQHEAAAWLRGLPVAPS